MTQHFTPPLDDVGEHTIDAGFIYSEFDLERLTDQLMDGEKPDDPKAVRNALGKIAARAIATLQWMDEHDA